jgi:bifunctional non-homologous end joining protein LigD
MAGLKAASAFIDGEAVLWRPDGLSDFDGLMSRAHDQHVLLYRFDLLELDGEDLRLQPLEERKAKLASLIAAGGGIQLSERLEGDGRAIFGRHAKWGLGLSFRSGGIPCCLRAITVLDQGAQSGERGNAAL